MTKSQTAEAKESATRTTTLDDLCRMGIDELSALYERATLPSSMAALDGAPAGRLLALLGPLGREPLASAVRRMAASHRFPWRGKSFTAHDDERGEGINRLAVLGDRYRFETRIEPSVLDGAPCIRLDYAVPENPFFIRAIRDELRMVDEGLFFGPALVDGAAPRLVLFFAIDCR